VEDLLKKTIDPCKQALSDAGKSPGDINEVVLVGGSTRIPKVQEIVREIFGKEPHRGVNPDEVVAIGAAIQAGVLTGDVKDLLLLDVTPLSLGIETLGGVFTKLIDRNTTIPTRRSETFSTAQDNQTSVEINVLQGEREMAVYNRTLGKFHLVGIPPAQRGVPQIEVTFDIDANGIVNVSAKDLGTGKEQKITITSSSGLSQEEIDKMMKEADTHAEDDKKQRELVDARNKADSMVYQTEKMLTENESKLPADEVKNIKDAIEKTKGTLKDGTADQINQSIEDLTKASHKLAEIMYQQSAAGQQAGGPDGAAPGAEQAAGDPAAGGKEDDVIDAEVVDDEKK